jgi:hypothetical protein
MNFSGQTSPADFRFSLFEFRLSKKEGREADAGDTRVIF